MSSRCRRAPYQRCGMTRGNERTGVFELLRIMFFPYIKRTYTTQGHIHSIRSPCSTVCRATRWLWPMRLIQPTSVGHGYQTVPRLYDVLCGRREALRTPLWTSMGYPYMIFCKSIMIHRTSYYWPCHPFVFHVYRHSSTFAGGVPRGASPKSIPMSAEPSTKVQPLRMWFAQ